MKNLTFEIFDFQKSEKMFFFEKTPKNIFKKMNRSKKIFFGRVEIFFEHQGIRKILLRIECAHSQRSKITLKHTFKESRKKSLFFVVRNRYRPKSMHELSEITLDPSIFFRGAQR